MRVSVALALCIVVSATGQFIPVTVFAQTSFVFTTIEAPGTFGNTYASGINNAGQVVGWFHDATGDHGFLRSVDGLTFITLDAPQGVGGTSLEGINDSGYSTGSFFNSTTNGRSFVASSSGSDFVNFDVPNAPGPTYAHKINNYGQIVGHFFSADSSGNGSPNVHGFLRNADGSFVTFDDPDAPVGILSCCHGTVGRGINDFGQIVGYLLGLNGNSQATAGFIRSGNGFVYTSIVVPSSRGTWPTDINNNGEIVGYFGDALSGQTLSFMRSSNGTFSVFNHPDAVGLTAAQGINDLGQVVGYFSDATGYHGFLATPIADHIPPVISGMPPAGCSIWPPNGKLVRVATVRAVDPESGLAIGSFRIVGSSNEESGANDILITPDGFGAFVIKLRADRLGKGTGRVYTLTATATDLAQNSSTVMATCTVPHDKR